jgi:hypothetical protein
LEDNEYSKDIEQSQRAEVEGEYERAIATIEQLYTGFLGYFKQYVTHEAQIKD